MSLETNVHCSRPLLADFIERERGVSVCLYMYKEIYLDGCDDKMYSLYI